jgi:peroxiredoxin Q/BCP
MAHKLQPGDAAPEFRLNSADGREISLGDFRGRWLALYFFPKALTPG